ncbi:MAG: methyltransferase domain-containing protein [candidate division Zixibacteria bacterium]|nr:methyltransferase domain-containing protein [candidate division Zixibacteria bacterium]
MSSEEKVKKYFQKKAIRFDTIYEENKSFSQKVVDRLFRQVVKDRFDLTFQKISELKGKTVLDVGCGSGRYTLEFVRKGAEKIVGIDFAHSMIDLANSYVKDLAEKERYQFICGDFMKYDFKDQFDYILAMGLFDYLRTPSDYLAKMKSLACGKIIASFPKRWTWRTPIRKIRLSLAGCSVYFYSRRDIERLLEENQINQYEIVNLSRDFILIADLGRKV